jgi:hypothetical protein
MWRLLMVVSVIPPLLVMALRWWHGTRVLVVEGGRMCRADLARWLPEPDTAATARRSEETARVIGFHLWRYALREWAVRDAKSAKARAKAKAFATAVTPCTVICVAFALVLGKVPVVGAFALVIASLAAAAVFAYLSLGAELREVARAANRLREAKAFRSRDDEDAVIACAMAHAWHQALPPVLRWLQGGKGAK